MLPHAVLFDLDGTLLDTAPDMLKALNRLRNELSLPSLPIEAIRSAVSHGSEAILNAGLTDFFSCDTDNLPDKSLLKERFLAHYQADIATDTLLFDGMEHALITLERHRIPWGIVTNKPGYLTFSILDKMNLSSRSAVVVCGDTTPLSKPDPLPLQHACGMLDIECANTLYLGDAERDIQAGRAAGMTTLIACFGYLAETDQPELWGADGMLDTPRELLNWLNLA